MEIKIKQRSKIKERLVSWLKRKISYLENENNCDFFTNGEAHFVDMWSGLKVIKPTVFDIGANKGDYTELILNKSDAVVYAFEPSASIFSSLRERFAKSESGVKLFNFGLSDTEEVKNLYFPSGQNGSELGSLYDRSILEKKNTEQVSLKRLDVFIEKNAISHIHLMKIDVEGHELNVLRGLGKYLNSSFIDFIQFEYGSCNVDSGTSLMQLYSILKDAGFIITKIMPSYLEERNYSKSLENYTHKNFVAISNEIKK